MTSFSLYSFTSGYYGYVEVGDGFYEDVVSHRKPFGRLRKPNLNQARSVRLPILTMRIMYFGGG